jgi:hypothetical protein
MLSAIFFYLYFFLVFVFVDSIFFSKAMRLLEYEARDIYPVMNPTDKRLTCQRGGSSNNKAERRKEGKERNERERGRERLVPCIARPPETTEVTRGCSLPDSRRNGDA